MKQTVRTSESRNISPAKISVNILGTPQILLNSKEVSLRSSRSFALIAYLCLELTPTPRKKMAELLWPVEEQPTNDRLRVLLSKLRRSTPNLINSTSTELSLSPSVRKRTDAISFLALHDKNTIPAYRSAIDSYTGDFLAGLQFAASPEFDKWLLHQQSIWREVLNFMYHQVVDHLLSEGKREGDLRDALFLAHKHGSIFPWSDEMIFKLVMIYIKKRQPDRALAAVNNYAQRITKEFDLELPQELFDIRKHIEEARIDLVTSKYPVYFAK